MTQTAEPNICTYCAEEKPTPHIFVDPKEGYCEECWEELLYRNQRPPLSSVSPATFLKYKYEQMAVLRRIREAAFDEQAPKALLDLIDQKIAEAQESRDRIQE